VRGKEGRPAGHHTLSPAPGSLFKIFLVLQAHNRGSRKPGWRWWI